MPPPYYSLGMTFTTEATVPARVCNLKKEGWPWYDFNLRKGYRKVSLPIGRYEIREIHRNMRYYHDMEHSDGYTYRLDALDRESPLRRQRISVWQIDLYDAIEGIEEEEEY